MPGERVAMVHGLATLAGAFTALDGQMVATKIDGSVAEGIRISKVKAALLLHSSTDPQNTHLEWGFAIVESAGQLEAAIDADPQYSEDPDLAEASQRKVYPCGVIGVGNGLTGINNTIVDDKEFKTLPDFPSWKVREHETLFMYVYNWGTSETVTVSVRYLVIGRWLND